jgi:hypothetical protein
MRVVRGIRMFPVEPPWGAEVEKRLRESHRGFGEEVSHVIPAIVRVANRFGTWVVAVAPGFLFERIGSHRFFIGCEKCSREAVVDWETLTTGQASRRPGAISQEIWEMALREALLKEIRQQGPRREGESPLAYWERERSTFPNQWVKLNWVIFSGRGIDPTVEIVCPGCGRRGRTAQAWVRVERYPHDGDGAMFLLLPEGFIVFHEEE